MTSTKRQREIARRRAERQTARRVERAAKRRRRNLVTVGVFGLVLLLIVGIWGGQKLFDDGDQIDPLAQPSASASTDPSASAKPGECAYTPGEAPKNAPGLPPAKPDLTDAEKASVTFDSGKVELDLLPAKAPCTVNSFAYLAAKNFFDGTECHRITTSPTLTVVQCGDPTATGTGGPGYSFVDENLEGATYKRGTLAMANSGPNTNGSQFFLVVKDSQLPPSYTPWGTITGGLDVLDKIIAAGAAGGAQDGKPAKKVTIKDFTVSK